MDINFDSLKRSISDELERSEFAIFRHDSGAFHPRHVVTWDVDTYPDYQLFLETARKLGARMMLFASTEFEESEIEDLQGQLEAGSMLPSTKRESERVLKTLRKHVGTISGIELAFPYESRFYVYEARPDWYEEFISVSEEIDAFSPLSLDEEEDDDEDDEGEGGIGGFYSNN